MGNVCVKVSFERNVEARVDEVSGINNESVSVRVESDRNWLRMRRLHKS